jgi:hypothetical protein
VNTERGIARDSAADRPGDAFPVLLGCFAGLLALESVAVLALVIWGGVQTARSQASDLAGALALLVCAALCVVWLVAMTVGTVRRRPWIRASSITWHLLVFAVAIGCFTGITAVPAAGWWLLALSIVGIALVVTPAVTRATARKVDYANDDTDGGSRR